MKKIESDTKKYINENDVKILYRVTIKYKGKNQIPAGILIEAKSLDDKFCICRFCYNVENNVVFKYIDGTVIEDKRILPKIKKHLNKIKINNKKEKNKETEKNTNYIINRKTNEIHLNSECNKLKKIEPKYINETTATIKELENAGLKQCNKCIK
jgi:hypothetical protein